MTFQDSQATMQFRARISDVLAEHWKLTLAQGLVLETLGILAFAMPLLSTLAVAIFIGWLFFIGGIVRVVTLLRTRHVPGYWWSFAAGVLAIVVGIQLAMNPFRGALTLTMLLTVLFSFEGISAIIAGLDFRHHAHNWGWLLFSGLADFLLVFLIWYGWPGTAAWAIGMLAGINLFLMGMSLVLLSLAVRQKARRT